MEDKHPVPEEDTFVDMPMQSEGDLHLGDSSGEHEDVQDEIQVDPVETSKSSGWGWGWISNAVSVAQDTISSVNETYVKPTVEKATASTAVIINDIAQAIDVGDDYVPQHGDDIEFDDPLDSVLDSGIHFLKNGATNMKGMIDRTVENRSVSQVFEQVRDNDIVKKGIHIGTNFGTRATQVFGKVGETAVDMIVRETGDGRMIPTIFSQGSQGPLSDLSIPDQLSYSLLFEQNGGSVSLNSLESLSLQAMMSRQKIYRKLSSEEKSDVDERERQLLELFGNHSSISFEDIINFFSENEEVSNKFSEIEDLKSKASQELEDIKTMFNPDNQSAILQQISSSFLQSVTDITKCHIEMLCLLSEEETQDIISTADKTFALAEMFKEDITTLSNLYLDLMKQLFDSDEIQHVSQRIYMDVGQAIGNIEEGKKSISEIFKYKEIEIK
eukprot:TRINITY_DN3361_c0_g1_i1.p1 TRINITY_DN3361_c0_g1~~TRINITY_DN3361_c0_g1_i1.p1  ORF type:complete len:442 (-),score=119.42 TRINITY_DN3361_c0_g1_i1:6-1331(-)